jgi:hypothetical protein
MRVKIKSLLGNQSKIVNNPHEVDTISDIDRLLKYAVTNRTTTIIRADGKETTIVYIGAIRTEVYNQKQLLVDWCNLRVDEFPKTGAYANASI